MIAHNTQGIGMADEADNPPGILPAGTVIQQIAYVTEPTGDQAVLVEFPAPLARRAVLVKNLPHAKDAPVAGQLSIMIVPTTGRDLDPESENTTLAQMRTWVEAAAPHTPPSQLLTLQNARIFWSPERIAILAPADRLETVREALIEATFYEAEVSAIERQLGTAWPQLEKDMPLAFEFEASSIPLRKQLRRRFQEVLLLRAKLARLGPHVHCPHLHPPTLASQIGERLRERTRLVHRHEFLTEQLEVFERVYEMCGQKASDYMLARTGHLLEWVIIVLLVISTLFGIYEVLKSGQTTAVPNPSAAAASSST
jgi:hypothetical protein